MNGYGIYFTEESNENEDLFDIEAKDTVKSPSIGPNVGNGSEVKKNKGKEHWIDM